MRTIFFLLLFFVCLQSDAQAQAQVIRQPVDLAPGDQYRLMFTTSTTRDATSANIDDYNSFVRTIFFLLLFFVCLQSEAQVIRQPVDLAPGDQYNAGMDATMPGHFYALSEVITAVPEPQTGVAMFLGVITVAACLRKRHVRRISPDILGRSQQSFRVVALNVPESPGSLFRRPLN